MNKEKIAKYKPYIPNGLTFFRILIIPVMLGFFFFETALFRWITLGTYILACVSDYFDGYFARSFNETSNIGKFFDSIADKLLVTSLLVMMVAFDHMSQISSLAALIIICREILVSGMREFISDGENSLPVTYLAKWKTTIQMIAIGILIVGRDLGYWFQMTGEITLWISAIITLITGFQYVQHFRKKYNEQKKAQ